MTVIFIPTDHSLSLIPSIDARTRTLEDLNQTLKPKRPNLKVPNRYYRTRPKNWSLDNCTHLWWWGPGPVQSLTHKRQLATQKCAWCKRLSLVEVRYRTFDPQKQRAITPEYQVLKRKLHAHQTQLDHLKLVQALAPKGGSTSVHRPNDR